MAVAAGTLAAADADAAAAKGAGAAQLEEEGSKTRRAASPWAYMRSLAWVRPVLIMAALYLLALAAIGAVFSQLPSLAEMAERHGGAAAAAASGGGGAAAAPPRLQLAVPHSFDELRAVRRTLVLYRRNYGRHVAALLVATHIFLQAFMMPGSILVNILAGSMYSLPAATGFAVSVDCAGAAANYWLVRWLLRDVVAGLAPGRVAAFAAEMQRHRANLLHYNLFIRTAPIFPSWVVNLASPIVGVPFPIFAAALVAGHLPINFISVKAGHNLAHMQAVSEIYSGGNVAVLACAGALALLPVLLRRLRRGERAARQRAGAGAGAPAASLLPIIAHTRDSMATAAAAAHKAIGHAAIGLPSMMPAALTPQLRVDGKHEL